MSSNFSVFERGHLVSDITQVLAGHTRAVSTAVESANEAAEATMLIQVNLVPFWHHDGTGSVVTDSNITDIF
jgi:hypothetical protein